MHRNTFLNSPLLLDSTYRLKKQPVLFFAGQMTGVEGYIESTSSGLVAGINAARRFKKQGDMIFPGNTAIGALARYISNPSSNKFQPMNINFGIIDPLKEKIKNKKERYNKVSNRALEEIGNIKNSLY